MPDTPLHLSDPEKVEAFVHEVLLDPQRTVPVVAISTVPKTDHVWIQPQPLHDELGDSALVVIIETGDATWRLSGLLPDRLDVFGGAVRVWWPGLHADSNPYDHPLNLIFDERKADNTRRQIVRSILEPGAISRTSSPAPRTSSAPSVDPWVRLGKEYRADYVVRGRIAHITDRYVLVELLPGATAIVHISELDYGWLEDPAQSFSIDQVVAVQLLSLDTELQRCEASIKRAYGQEVRPGIRLGPDDPPFLGDAVPEAARPASGDTQRVDELEEERQQLLDERKSLVARMRELNEQLATQRKEIKSLEDRMAHRERQQELADPLSSETAFLSAVRVEYALRFGEDDRSRYPLQSMKVGREFLSTVRTLGGIETDKILEVAAQVASGRCHEIKGRAVHELHAGEGGTPTRARASDGARAWRCALQIGTPSARRLHWWSIPGSDGATIEFASVAVHDDFGIPD